MTPQHFNTIPTSLVILPTMLVTYVYRRVVESSGVGGAGCVVHVDVHGKVMLRAAAT